LRTRTPSPSTTITLSTPPTHLPHPPLPPLVMVHLKPSHNGSVIVFFWHQPLLPRTRSNTHPQYHHHLIHTTNPPPLIPLCRRWSRRARNRAKMARFSSFFSPGPLLLAHAQTRSPVPPRPCLCCCPTSPSCPPPPLVVARPKPSHNGSVFEFFFLPLPCSCSVFSFFLVVYSPVLSLN
jgi:hypothetical protein